MKKKWTAILTAALVLGCSLTALAATAISSVKIELNIDMEAGDALPDLHVGYIGDNNCEVMIPSNDRYDIDSAKWSSDVDEVKMGSTYTMKIYLDAMNDYRFNNSYASSKIKVSGGEFVSAQRQNSGNRLIVTVKTKPTGGTYEDPYDAYWETTNQSNSKLGIAKWSKVQNAYYDVYLYRGDKQVHKVNGYSGTSYNFYPYMTSRGTYTFRVRAVARDSEASRYAKSSDWTHSDEVYVDEEHVSDGSDKDNPQTGLVDPPSGNQVGWIQESGRWFYRYPDGSYLKDSWGQINGSWYLFDSQGVMQTGWRMVNGAWYYMNENGAMQTGWILLNGNWYFLYDSGAMAAGWIQLGNKRYYLSDSGAMVTGWQNINGLMYYFYPDGNMAADAYIDGFYVGLDGVWRRP